MLGDQSNTLQNPILGRDTTQPSFAIYAVVALVSLVDFAGIDGHLVAFIAAVGRVFSPQCGVFCCDFIWHHCLVAHGLVGSLVRWPALVGAGVVHWLVLAAPPMVSQASTGGLASVARYRCGVFGDVAKLRT